MEPCLETPALYWEDEEKKDHEEYFEIETDLTINEIDKALTTWENRNE